MWHKNCMFHMPFKVYREFSEKYQSIGIHAAFGFTLLGQWKSVYPDVLKTL